MPRQFGVVSFGEALVDFLPDRRGRLRDCKEFAVHSGGAPSNVAVGLARLGVPTAFCGVLGDDEFGQWLQLQLSSEGIDARLRFTHEAPTGIWFIALDEQGNRSFFTPTGAASADKLLADPDVARAPIAEARWLHTGTSAHVRPEGRTSLIKALEKARASGTRTCCDPNVRVRLWSDLGELRALCDKAFPLCDLVKISEDETELCTGTKTPEEAAEYLINKGVQLACITLAERGVLARRGNDVLRVPAPEVDVVDTTGAGDGFVAGLLSKLSGPEMKSIAELSLAELESALKFGCLIGSRVCTQVGAVAALPRASDLTGE
jgi:fructokinase